MSSEGLRPRAVVKINGKQTTPISFSVDNNTHFQADTFKVSLEAWSQPDGFGIAYWDTAENVLTEVFVGYLDDGQDPSDTPDDLTSLILGQVDDVEIDTTTGDLHITGRDLTAKLIDTKTTTMWPDLTASQIVTKLATQAGLTPNVTATTTPAGKYSQNAYAQLGREIPLWDLVTFLADNEGFDAYVSGTTLYFGPPQATSNPPWPISCTKDQDTGQIICSTETLKLKRSLTLAKDITVTVLCHNVKSGKPIQAVAKRQGASKTASSSSFTGQSSQNYVLRRPNLTQAQALQLAQKTLADLSRFEHTFEATAPNDSTLTARSMASITGTGSDWDQSYYLDKITRTFEFGTFDMSLSGKNHPVESEPTI